ncbi:IS1096 element passenger TnpR family protein [Aquimarina agarilytica]|uniref:IS1096 element passenger TnpR family protein n=1 Tax=Aquimarina agarilytica TaxID=1087449 RepID=UPI00028A2D9A|nr:hypothetical protein [Aquimarina agarilytica]
MIYRFRIILDIEEDVFRDIEIEKTATAEEFHNSITQAFGFDGTEMASFYISNDQWDQGEEISLFDMSDGSSPVRLMNETSLEDITSEKQTRLLYVYDFLSMWTFMVELAEIATPEAGRTYPNLMFAHGELPDSAPDKNFESESLDFNDLEGEFEDDLNIDDYDNLGFEEHWN